MDVDKIEKINKLAATLKNSGLAPSMDDAVKMASDMIGEDLPSSTDVQERPHTQIVEKSGYKKPEPAEKKQQTLVSFEPEAEETFTEPKDEIIIEEEEEPEHKPIFTEKTNVNDVLGSAGIDIVKSREPMFAREKEELKKEPEPIQQETKQPEEPQQPEPVQQPEQPSKRGAGLTEKEKEMSDLSKLFNVNK